MRNMINRILFVIVASLCIIGLIFFCFLNSNVPRNTFLGESIKILELENKAHIELLEDSISEHTIAYKNKNGSTTLYVFSEPICYRNSFHTWEIINNDIVEVVDNEKYAYQVANNDIVSMFPKYIDDVEGIRIIGSFDMDFCVSDENKHIVELIERPNFIGKKKKMCQYCNIADTNINMYAYPSTKGINCEFECKDDFDGSMCFVITLDIEGVYLQKECGCLIINQSIDKNESRVIGIIQTPIIRTDCKDIVEGELNYEKINDNQYQIKFNGKKGNFKKNSMIFLSVEMRRECQSDNTIYSAYPDLTNAYLKNIYYIGYEKIYGIGRTMMRFNVNNIRLRLGKITNAKYYTYVLGDNVMEYETCKMLEDWCGVEGNWNCHYKTGKTYKNVKVENNILDIDLSEECEAWENDLMGMEEYNGILLKSSVEKEGVYNMILSNDNTLYPTRLEVTYEN